jgi:hypothetical protein
MTEAYLSFGANFALTAGALAFCGVVSYRLVRTHFRTSRAIRSYDEIRRRMEAGEIEADEAVRLSMNTHANYQRGE